MKPKTTHLVTKTGQINEMKKRSFEDKTLQLLWDCFIKLQEMDRKDNIYPKDFESYDFSKDFDFTDVYDFEVIVEDAFFSGKDIIPDGLFHTIKQFKNFIEKELKK